MRYRSIPILVLVIVFPHASLAQENLGFFGEIHDGGYPSFDWLTTELVGFDYSHRFQTGPNSEPNDESNVRIVRKSNYYDNLYKSNIEEKQYHLEKEHYPEYDPSLLMYQHTNQEENMSKIDILEPELNEVYSNDREPIPNFEGTASQQ